MTGATYIQIRMTGGAGDDVVGLGGWGGVVFQKLTFVYHIYYSEGVNAHTHTHSHLHSRHTTKHRDSCGF